MKNVLITGGCGFIGSNFVEYLANREEYHIVVLDKLTYAGNLKNLEAVNSLKYTFINGDICNKKVLNELFEKYKFFAVFHFAAESHVDRSIDSPKQFIQTNIFGTFNLLEVSRFYMNKLDPEFKFIHVSTDEVYGDINKNISVNESYNYNPSSPYSASKAGADQLIKSYYRTYGSKVVIANSCNNYGPRQLPEKFIPKVIFNIIQNKPIPVYGKGTNVREWIYVKDNCEALIKIFEKGKIGKNYNIGSGIRVKNLNIIKLILRIAKKNKIYIQRKVNVKFVKDRPGHDKRYAINSGKIKKELKWKHKISLIDGLNKTFSWYLNNKKFFKQISKKNINKRFGLKI